MAVQAYEQKASLVINCFSPGSLSSLVPCFLFDCDRFFFFLGRPSAQPDDLTSEDL